MYLAGDAPLPRRVRVHAARRAAPRAAPTTRRSACCSRSTARTSRGSAPTRRCSQQAPLVVDIDHHHDNTRFGDVNLIVADASSTGEVLRDLFAELDVELTPEIAEALYIALVTDTGRFQYANTTPKSLRLAAELVEAGRRRPPHLPGRLRVGRSSRSSSCSRERSSGRRCTRAAGSSSRYLLRDRLRARSAPPSRTPRGSSTTCAPSRAPTWRCSSASRRATAAPTRRRQPAREPRRARRLRDRAEVRRRRPPPGGRVLERGVDRGDHGLRPARVRRGGSRRRDGRSRARSSRRGSCWSTSRPAPRRSRSSPSCAGGRARGRVTRGRSTRSPRACSWCCPVGQLNWPDRSSGSTSATSRRSTSRSTTSTGDPEGEIVERHDAPSREELEERLEGLRGEVELPIPAASAVKIGGERAYRLHRRGVAVEMPRAASRVDALDVIAYSGETVTLDLRVSSGTYVRSIAEALGGHCRTLRRTEVGPFSVDEADPERVIPVDEALAPARMTVGASCASRRSSSRIAARRSRSGTFDGVHLGHRRVLEAAERVGADTDGRHVRPAPADGARPPGRAAQHARAAAGAARGGGHRRTCSCSSFDARVRADSTAGAVRRALPARDRRRGRRRPAPTFRFGHEREGDLDLLRRLGFDVRAGAARRRRLVERDPVARARGRGRRGAARLLGRPPEVDGVVVRGDARGGTLGFRPRTCGSSRTCSCRRSASTPGARAGHRAAISIGVNPHYGGAELRSSRSCSTTRATCTASASSSSSGAGSATSGRSGARTSSSRRSPATSRRRGARSGLSEPPSRAKPTPQDSSHGGVSVYMEGKPEGPALAVSRTSAASNAAAMYAKPAARRDGAGRTPAAPSAATSAGSP